MRVITSLIGVCMMLLIAGTVIGAEDSDSAPAKAPSGRALFDFNSKEDAKQWQSVNDNVMGGISKGRSKITGDGTLEFTGDLSLENRGGFASIRSQKAKLGLKGHRDLVLRVKGDGRKYNCNLHVPTLRVAFSYRASFKTKPGKWNEVRIPLADFKATWFGRQVPGSSPVDPAKVNSVGITIADKKQGPFRLEIDWIKAE